jgi:AcrR family transcriptional regulator
MPLESLETPDSSRMAKRGEGRQYALIMAGLELFGEHGIKGTTTRMLAETAGANIAAIPYYFGSKEGLYLAVVEYIAKRITAHIGEMTQDIPRSAEDGPLGKKEALAALHTILGGFAWMFVESDEPKSWAHIIMREQAKPTRAFDILYDRYMKRLQQMVNRLAGACTGLDPDGDEVKIRTHALFGQILVFLVSRETILRGLGVEKLTGAHVDLIHRVLAAHAEACLKIPSIRR